MVPLWLGAQLAEVVEGSVPREVSARQLFTCKLSRNEQPDTLGKPRLHDLALLIFLPLFIGITFKVAGSLLKFISLDLLLIFHALNLKKSQLADRCIPLS